MEMFLTVLSLSVVGVLVSGVLFAVATRDARHAEAAALDPIAVPDEERFFILRPAQRVRHANARIPADVLVLQIERHVRLEHAAAESFLQFPSVEALHMRTLSPLAR
ncbi:MAG TPA: hypothetical protein VL225_12865 [Vicinamibacterales bacterium]|jgi:hypothetical protein|nr:hypothetical protein [Vicinamibacterales bacterium]